MKAKNEVGCRENVHHKGYEGPRMRSDAGKKCIIRVMKAKDKVGCRENVYHKGYEGQG